MGIIDLLGDVCKNIFIDDKFEVPFELKGIAHLKLKMSLYSLNQ